jgi:O-antigen/teichoic acid export membrane protein
MRSYKQLASQTAIYGVSSIIGRLLNYLLTPLYTYTLSKAAFGVVTEMYAYVALLMVIFTFGMETAFFRFNETHGDKKAVFSTSATFLGISSIFLILLTSIFRQPLADLILYPQHPEYVMWFGMIIALDAFTAIPFARLRAEGKALRFVGVRLGSIGINVILNLIFILLIPHLLKTQYGFFGLDGSSFVHVRYIFIANVASSLGALLLLGSTFRGIRLRIDRALLRPMLAYGLPLVIFGLAGSINETLDRILLKYLLPEDIAMEQLGIYGACYKIAILMTIFIQAFRYAAEPFFFAKAKDADARQTYAGVMVLFVGVMSVIFAATMLMIDVVIYFVGPDFRVGAGIIPIQLMSHLFLGIFYNLSVWYKLTDRTMSGALISVFGAAVTISLNIWLIPRIGYMGSAWATFICYATMMLLSYFWGQKYYHVPYDVPRLLLMPGMAALVWYLSTLLPLSGLPSFLANIAILMVFIMLIVVVLRKELREVFPSKGIKA